MSAELLWHMTRCNMSNSLNLRESRCWVFESERRQCLCKINQCSRHCAILLCVTTLKHVGFLITPFDADVRVLIKHTHESLTQLTVKSCITCMTESLHRYIHQSFSQSNLYFYSLKMLQHQVCFGVIKLIEVFPHRCVTKREHVCFNYFPCFLQLRSHVH